MTNIFFGSHVSSLTPAQPASQIPCWRARNPVISLRFLIFLLLSCSVGLSIRINAEDCIINLSNVAR